MTEQEFRYPGTLRDYRRQALQFSIWTVLFGAGLLVVIYAVDRYVIGVTALRSDRAMLTVVIVAAAVSLSLLMARSLAGFRITAGPDGLTVRRGTRDEVVPWSEVAGLTRAKLPWFWPLRADLRSRQTTARHMWRIVRRRGPYISFVSGLVDEEQLMEIIRAGAGLEEG